MVAILVVMVVAMRDGEQTDGRHWSTIHRPTAGRPVDERANGWEPEGLSLSHCSVVTQGRAARRAHHFCASTAESPMPVETRMVKGTEGRRYSTASKTKTDRASYIIYTACSDH